jgi:D-lactate dehydrogenase
LTHNVFCITIIVHPQHISFSTYTGPAFTERALYLKIDKDEKTNKKVVKIVNTLGIEGFDQQEGEFNGHSDDKETGVIAALNSFVQSIAGKQQQQQQQDTSVVAMMMKKSNNSYYGQTPASDVDYKNRVCQDDHQVSRCNADTRGCECNRSEGKVMILASVHDTFQGPERSKTFWVSFDTLDSALEFRRQVCLHNPKDLPISMEYMDRDSFDVIDRAGRVLGNTIKAVGTSSSVVRDFWNVKLFVEALPFRGSSTICDKFLYFINSVVPALLPKPLMELGRKMDHHVAMTVGDFNDGSLDRFLERMEAFQCQKGDAKMVVHECTTKDEETSLTAFRFVEAPAFRTWCIGQGVHGFSVDYALPRNGGQAPSVSSSSSSSPSTTPLPLKRMRYSHFACNVVHEDVAFAPGVDVDTVKLQLKESVEQDCHGKLPAEHGHGTEYHAPEETQARWKRMDPLNVMNPGVGGLPSTYSYKETTVVEEEDE